MITKDVNLAKIHLRGGDSKDREPLWVLQCDAYREYKHRNHTCTMKIEKPLRFGERNASEHDAKAKFK